MTDFNEFKDIITGTIGSIVDKAKEVANSGTVKSVYEQGAARAKSYGRIAKLTLELNGSSEELKRVYTEIGRLYYAQAKESPEGAFEPLFAQAGELMARMEAKEEEIASLKAQLEAEAQSGGIEVDITVERDAEADGGSSDFDTVVSATEPEHTPEDGEE